MKDANRTSADTAYQTELKLDFTGQLQQDRRGNVLRSASALRQEPAC